MRPPRKNKRPTIDLTDHPELLINAVIHRRLTGETLTREQAAEMDKDWQMNMATMDAWLDYVMDNPPIFRPKSNNGSSNNNNKRSTS